MPKRFDAIIFDMDGTLIEPLLDFQAIRRDLNIPAGKGILETLDEMDTPEAAAAHERLLSHEMAAAKQSIMMPAADTVLASLRQEGYRTALLTRNALGPMQLVLERFEFEFDLAWSRENGPIKPEPDGVLKACKELGVNPNRTVCVGDFQYDIQAANAAGATSVLLATGELPDFAHTADHVIRGLTELLVILKGSF